MAKIEKSIFREYDIRGIAGKDLTKDVANLVGKGFGTHLKEKGVNQIVVGRDNRLSSEDLTKGLIEGLLSVGCSVIDIGLSLSPIVYYISRFYLKTQAGVMVTGSHNPAEFNGFKLVRDKGCISGEEIQKVRRIIERGNFSQGKGQLKTQDLSSAYLKMIKNKIKLGPKKLKVVLDCGNGTASLFAPKLLRELGIEITPLFCQSDGHFPNHLPDPTKVDYLSDLIKKVKEEKADLGLGIDGDADRLGAIDDRGNIIWGDKLMILFSREIFKKHPKAKIIVEVKCSQGLYEDVLAHGGIPIFWKTGHSLIEAKMHQEKALLTGEMSGHLFFGDEYYSYDDAPYAAGRLLRILSNTKKTFSELLADTPQYYATPELRPPCSDEDKFKVTTQIVKNFKKKYKDRVIDIDGARVMFDDGWGLVRASNTEPALIVRAEGKTKEALRKIKKIIEEEIIKFPQVKFDWGN